MSYGCKLLHRWYALPQIVWTSSLVTEWPQSRKPGELITSPKWGDGFGASINQARLSGSVTLAHYLMTSLYLITSLAIIAASSL
jgi:hypothetical protein